MKAIPLSKAKTAWGLLLDVKKAIRSEPKRANMSVYCDKLAPQHGGPACGTVGCFAGWVMLLRGEEHSFDAAFPASQLLGGSKDAGGVIDFRLPSKQPGFILSGFHVFNSGGGDACMSEVTQPGTKAHAKAVIDRIDRFMKKNEKALKSVKLEPISEVTKRCSEN